MKTMLSITAIAAMLAIPAYAEDAAKTMTPDTAATDTAVTKDAMTAKPTTPAEPAAAVPVDTMAKTPADDMAKTPAETMATTPAETAAVAKPAVTGEIRYLPSQSGGEFLASRVMGAYVINNANETVGDINDIVLDKSGKVTGVIIGVGGFLGMGERNVAVAYEPSQISTDANGKRIIKLNVTKETLQNAPIYVKRDKAS